MPVRRYAATYVGATNVPIGDEIETQGVVNTNTGGLSYSAPVEYALPLPPPIEPVKIIPVVNPVYAIDTPTFNTSIHVKGVIADSSILLNTDTRNNNGLIAPPAYINEEDPFYLPYDTDISGGGGGSQSLDQVLAIGNSVGTYDIDMNANNIENVNTIFSSLGQDIAIAGDASISLTTLNGEIGLVGKDILIKKTNALSMARMLAFAAPEEPSLFSIPPDTYLDIESEDNIKINSTGVVDVYGTSMNIFTEVDMSSNKITHLATPVDNADAATKLYVDTAAGGGASNWSAYPAINPVDISGEDINNVELITGLPVIGNPIVINNSYNLGNTLSQHALIVAGGFDTTGVEIKPVAVAIKKEAFYTGSAEEELGNLNFIGLDDVADEQLYAHIKTFVQDNTKAIVDSKMTLGVATNGVVSDMIEVDGSNNRVKIMRLLDMSNNKISNLATPTLSTDAATKLYVDTAVSGGSQSLAQVLAVGNTAGTNIDMSGNDIIRVSDITNTSGTLNITADDLNLSCTGLTSVLNIGSTFGTLISSTGAVDITAGGLVAINAVGNISIGSTGTTSIENFNLNNSVLSKVPATSDLQLNNIATITNTAGNIDISATNVRVDNFNINGNVLSKLAGASDLQLTNISNITNTGGNVDISATNVRVDNFNINGSVLTKLAGAGDLELNNISQVYGESLIDISATDIHLNGIRVNGYTLESKDATRITLDDVEIINNDAVGGEIGITAATIRVNDFLMSGSTLTANGADFTLNNIGKLNDSTPGSFIDSYATLNAVGTGLTDAVGFKATTLTATSGTAVAFYSDNTEATASSSISAGAYFGGTTANNTDGEAKGLWVQTILGGATSGTATGVEVAGSMTGATKRGFWEHSSSANVMNTFMNPVGIGKDPSGAMLDVSGTASYDTLVADRIGIGLATPNTSLALDVAGRTQIVTTTGGVANPTLILESTNDTAPGVYLELYHNRANPAIGDRTGVLTFQGEDSAPGKVEYGRIRNVVRNFTTGSHSGAFDFYVANNGTTKDYMNIDGSENAVVINPTKNIAGASFKIFDSTGPSTNNTLMNADCSNANVMFKNYPQRYIYDICGNYTLTLPNAFNTMRIVAYGAGGGGGSGRKGTTSCFGGGAGAGGNGVEVWYDRRELLPDASGSITLYITPGKGGDGGAGVSTLATNGNNGANGGTTYVNLNAFGAGASQRLIPDTATSGGNGGGGGTTANGNGGTAPTFSSDRNIGSAGRSGASSSVTAQPVRNTTALLYNGSVYSQTGGSGAGGGIDAAGTSQFAGGIFVSPCGQKYNGLGANVNKGGAAGTAGGTPGGNGDIVSFDQLGSAAVRPLAGMCSLMGGGGASLGGNGGNGGGWTYGVAGSRGDGGGGGGATGNASLPSSGAGGRGADGCVIITIW